MALRSSLLINRDSFASLEMTVLMSNEVRFHSSFFISSGFLRFARNEKRNFF